MIVRRRFRGNGLRDLHQPPVQQEQFDAFTFSNLPASPAASRGVTAGQRPAV